MFPKVFKAPGVLLVTLFCGAVTSQVAEHSSQLRGLASSSSCPPSGFDAKKDVDLDSFVSDRWYSIQQKEVFYQPANEAYCVYAEYGIDTNSFCPFCGNRPRISVFNRSQKGSVSGPVNSIQFGGFIPKPKNDPGKAFVAPKFIANTVGRFIPTNYWIIDAGTDEQVLTGRPSSGTTYDWAIITAGTANEDSGNGKCTAGGGQWIFHRDPEPSRHVIAALEARTNLLGLDTTQLITVEHDGCTY